MNISDFSNEQIAGQRLMAGFDGTRLNDDLIFLIGTLKIGGIILFSRNLTSPDQIKNLCMSVQEYAIKCGQPPLFISIDQEGGQVARLKEPFTQFPGNPSIKDEEDAVHFAETTASELKNVGINMNMAPVLDVAFDNKKSIMRDRSLGNDPEWVSMIGVTVIERLQRNEIMAVAKHFPGIGRTVLDPHIEMPPLDADLRTLESSDLRPFYEAIKHDVAGIMLSHILYSKIDIKWPASLSTKIAKDLLRDRMDFDGIVMTDDLDMGAIKSNCDIKTVIKQILSADIDIALICHKGPNIEIAYEEILKEFKESKNIKTKGKVSVKRILKTKEKYLKFFRF
ncbi:MAG: beta-N-acetylhexosaminidase [Desulfobacteraceae bacterium]|nr:beta-N-acetylhexosaminidase [Desulfobacteraceae bacterium]MBC2719260.1 beta-N-acetylhexosaminidase [Desulfobacteraceae bacterium]